MTTPPSTSPFPVGSSVLLRGLVGASHLNGTKGIVRSRPPRVNDGGGGDDDDGDDAPRYRQEVYVFEAKKAMAIRPANLRYEPRSVEGLTASEMRGAMRVLRGDGSRGVGPESLSGMDKDELRRLFREEVEALVAVGGGGGDDDDDVGERIAELVAMSNEPAPGGAATSSSSSRNNNGGGAAVHGTSAEQLRQGAERMASMTPDDIRRQASAMRSMGPSTLRAMNPQMANMSDEQINMAIAQMEAVASDPSQLRMAADQMRNMSEGDLKRALDQTATAMGGAGGKAPTATAAAATPSSPAPPVSREQLEQAARQMSSMSPAQLKQQAAMLRSMPFDALRNTNPHMSGMTDAQIEASIAQLEMMANNPDMMKMAVDALSDPDKLNSAMNSADSLGAVAGGMLSDPGQLNSAVKAMKQNPHMLKQMLTSQKSVSESQKEQMTRVIDSFATMDDAKLESYLRLANAVQKVAVRPIMRAKDALGLSTRTTLFLLWITMTLPACLAVMLAWRWWYGTRNDGVGTSTSVEENGGPTPFARYYDVDSEF